MFGSHDLYCFYLLSCFHNMAVRINTPVRSDEETPPPPPPRPLPSPLPPILEVAGVSWGQGRMDRKTIIRPHTHTYGFLKNSQLTPNACFRIVGGSTHTWKCENVASEKPPPEG